MNRRADYNTVDWSLTDAEIAAQLGVTRRAVCAARANRKLPKSASGHGGKRDNAGRKKAPAAPTPQASHE